MQTPRLIDGWFGLRAAGGAGGDESSVIESDENYRNYHGPAVASGRQRVRLLCLRPSFGVAQTKKNSLLELRRD